jgi:hypothetical protein
LRNLLVLAVLPSLCLADAASQTDWSGGPVFGGTSTSWTNVFASADGVDWSTSPGQLLLEVVPARSAANELPLSGTDDYVLEGFAFSSILNTQCNPDWGAILWSAATPSGTVVQFNVRASDVYWEMGDWSDTITSPQALAGYVDDGAQYFQYRAFLGTGNAAVTPSLNEITISWNPILGVEDGSTPASIELLPISPNPASGPASVGFALPDPASVELLVFDISGKLVQSPGSVEYQPGWHTVQLGELSPGIYFVRIRAGGFGATERFVVVE